MTDPDLLAEVLRRPSVLWAVLTAGTKIMGPWKRTDRQSERESADYYDDGTYGCCHGSWVAIYAGKSKGGPVWRVKGEVGAMAFPTRAEAESWCDARLREAGWVLVDGDVGVNHAE